MKLVNLSFMSVACSEKVNHDSWRIQDSCLQNNCFIFSGVISGFETTIKFPLVNFNLLSVNGLQFLKILIF